MKKNSSPPFQRKKRPKYIFDTSSVIALLEVCQLGDVLFEFSKKANLHLPHKVKDEFLDGNPLQTHANALEKIFSIGSCTVRKELLPYFHFDSDCGEIWVISYAIEKPEYCCVIDEEFGRNICRLFKVKLTGSIGIISKLKNLGYLTNADLIQLKKLLRKSPFYISEELLNELC